MIDRIPSVVYRPALVLAWTDAALVPASIRLPHSVMQDALWMTVAMATTHFVLMLFDGATHRALNAYNGKVLERAGGQLSRQDFIQFRREVLRSLNSWPLLKWTALVLICETMIAALVPGRNRELLVQLTFSAFFLSLMITILKMKTVPILAHLAQSTVPTVHVKAHD